MSLDCKARLIKIKGFGMVLCTRLQSGDTLIEVIVAMLILGMMILGLSPLFAKIHLYERINASKAEAYNLAEGQIEAIRSAPWPVMGTLTGDPPGQFAQVATYGDPSTPGIIYYIDTQIRYKPDPSRAPGDPTTVDYKDITVEVQVQIPGLPSALLPSVTLNTRVTQQNQWGETPGGNIYVEAEDENSNPVGNMAVFLLGPWGPNLTTYEGWTDSPSGDMPGTYLFASLLPGTYTMVATDSTDPWDGYVVAPGTQGTVGAGNPPILPLSTGGGQWCTITTNETTYMSFQAEPAPQVTLNFNHPSGTPYSYSGSIQLQSAECTYPTPTTSYSANGKSLFIGSIYPGSYNIIDLGTGYSAGSIQVNPVTASNPNEPVPVIFTAI